MDKEQVNAVIAGVFAEARAEVLTERAVYPVNTVLEVLENRLASAISHAYANERDETAFVLAESATADALGYREQAACEVCGLEVPASWTEPRVHGACRRYM